jgi:hypothetical protein
VLPDRVRLSMKEVNQYNGKEFNKKDTKIGETGAVAGSVGSLHPDIGNLTGIKIEN